MTVAPTVVRAASPIDLPIDVGTQKTIDVYPDSVTYSQWSGYQNVLVQYVADDAIYQKFNVNNSAYINSQTTHEDKVAAENAAAAAALNQGSNVVPAMGQSSAATSTTPTSSSVPTIPTASSTEVPVTTPVLLPATNTSSAATTAVSFRRATASLFAFFSEVTRFLPFMAAGTSSPTVTTSTTALTTSSPSVVLPSIPVIPKAATSATAVATSTNFNTAATTSEIKKTNTDVAANASSTVTQVPVPKTTLATTTATTSTVASSTVALEAATGTPATTTPTRAVATSANTYSLTVKNFGVPKLDPGQSVTNMQLRVSMAGEYDAAASSSLPYVDVTLHTASGTIDLGSVVIDGQISNSLNGGYYLFAFPTFTNLSILNSASVTLTYVGDTTHLKSLYLDSVWLQVSTRQITRNDLLQYEAGLVPGRLKDPQASQLISTERNFTVTEDPVFNLRYRSHLNSLVSTVRNLLGFNLVQVAKVEIDHNGSGPLGLQPDIHVTSDGLITVAVPSDERRKLKPGVYTVHITYNEGGIITTDSFDFEWGLLAINPSKTTYDQGDTATISMGALSANGDTVCDANLRLYVVDPAGNALSEIVTPSGQCQGNNVVSMPDYTSTFIVDQPGQYEMHLERVDAAGNLLANTIDTFYVVQKAPLSIERNGPTRIYPPATYPMQLIVHAVNAFSGTLTEHVPDTFKVDAAGATVTDTNGEYALTWPVTLAAGETQTFSYIFNAPDLSPFLYQLGPAALLANGATLPATTTPTVVDQTAQNTLGVSTSTSVTASTTASSTATTTVPVAPTTTTAQSTTAFVEHRDWQIASDATGNMILYWDGTGGLPAGWTCLSCGSGTFYQKFAMGSSTYNTTGGVANTTATASGSVLADGTTALGISSTAAGTVVSAHSHTHTFTPTINSVSILPAYRQLRVIEYTGGAGEPATLPTGVIGIFDATVPAGWTRYSAQDNYYIYGGNAPGTTGGANTVSHTITGTFGGSSGSYRRVTGGTQVTVAANAHTHTVSTTTPALDHQPPYITAILGQLNATTTPPNGLIAMWTNTVPGGWLDESSAPTDPFYQRFLKPSATYGVTGGTTTRTVADMNSIVSSGPSATITTRSGTNLVADDPAHTHLVNVTGFSAESNIPPYLTIIYGKRLGSGPIYTQEHYQWYTNENAQTPTDPWPSGATLDLAQDEAISATSTPVKNGDVVRLRVNTLDANATTTGKTFKLQYGVGSDCSAVASWSNVGGIASTSIWRGYDNSAVVNGSTLSSAVLGSTTVNETYQEDGQATSTPNAINVGKIAEWDFVLQQNGAAAGTQYCFRMVTGSSTPFLSYANYPQLLTNSAPATTTLTQPFDNAQATSTLPAYTFYSSDPEADDLDYQIQISTSHSFSTTVEDKNSISNATAFTDISLPSDKAPFTNGQLVQFTPTVALTNGTTYWWRVRAKDRNGSGSWGGWSTPYSYTVNSSVTASSWFQTTQDQFNNDALVGVVTNGSGYAALATGSTTGTITSQTVTFANGEHGTAWKDMKVNRNVTAGTLIYRLQYVTATGTWANVPDTDLPGNSTGFTAASVSLLNLDTAIYDQLRLVATLTNVGGSSQLLDWTIDWGYRVNTPTVNAPFDNEKVGTTTPYFNFTTTDPLNNDLTYQIQWSTSPNFTASTTRTSGTNAGFSDLTSVSKTDPFYSGDEIQFHMQAVDALTNGTTYWWRVRAKDTTGSNVYSFWTDAQSFTVDTTVSVSTWFQTTSDQFNVDTLSGTTPVVPGSVSVASTSNTALIVYGEGTSYQPKYRLWNGTSWGTQHSLNAIGAPLVRTRVKAGTTRSEYVAATLGTDSDVNVQVYSNGAWGDFQNITTNSGSLTSRPFDVTYETLSGRAMVVSCNNSANPIYYLWDGSTWTAGGTITSSLTANCSWIQLVSNPTSNQIILLMRATNGTVYQALVWNGTSWGNSTTLDRTSTVADEGMAVQYEESANQALILGTNRTNNRFYWKAWSGAAWSGLTTQAIGNDFEWGSVIQNVGNDQMAVCYQDASDHVGVVRWTGAAWTGQTTLQTGTGYAATDPGFSCVFEHDGTHNDNILLSYTTNTQTQYRTWNGTAWSTAAQINAMGPTVTSQLERTGVGMILGAFFDKANNRLLSSNWSGTAWSTTQTLEANMSVNSSPYGSPYNIAPANPVSSGTVVGSPVVFNTGSGPYWQSFSWTDTKPGASTIKYQLQYFDGTTWSLIPDTALPNNSTGLTSPVNLTGLNKNTYGEIRPYATLTCDGSGNCPAVNDWTINWAAGLTISGTAQQYNESTNVTSGTVAVAVNGVLQTGKTGTISGGTWSINNVNVNTGDTVTVFVSGATGASQAVAVTKYAGIGNITGIKLFQHHLSLGSDDATTTPLTNADIGLYDYAKNTSIFSKVTGSTLAVCGTTGCGDVKLYIGPNMHYTPGGVVRTRDLVNHGTLTATSTLYVNGSWVNNATSTLTGSTVVLEATSTTVSIDSTGATVSDFNNLTIGTTTGAASWNLITALAVNGNLLVQGGTLSRGTLPITIGGNLTTASTGVWSGVATTTFSGATSATWSDANATLQNIGRVVVDGTAKTVTLAGNVKAQSITIGLDDFLNLGTGSYSLTDLGNFNNQHTVIPGNGTVVFGATTAATITLGSSPLYNASFNGTGGSWSFTDSAITLNHNLALAAGTLTMPTGTTTISGSFTVTGGSFAHNNGAMLFNGSGAQSVTLLGSGFTNSLYNVKFAGSGTYTFTDANATTSNTFTKTTGTVVLPTGTLAVGGSFVNTGGSLTTGGDTLLLYKNGGASITLGTASLGSVKTVGTGTYTFTDNSATLSHSLTVSSGTVVLPASTLAIGGSLTNNGTLTPGTGTVLFNATTTGNTINLGASNLYNTTFNSSTGGWTITGNATSTHDFDLAAAASFTQQSGTQLSVGNSFTNNVGGASTTWTGSTLALATSTFSINTKTQTGDAYNVIQLGSGAHVSMWNSSASTVNATNGGWLYSENNAGTRGDLYIYGNYVRNTGTEHWDYATDFDGTALSGTSTRQAVIRFDAGASATFGSGATLHIVGTSTASTTIDKIATGNYGITVASSTIDALYYQFKNMNATGLHLTGHTIVTSLESGAFEVSAASGTAVTVASTTIDANPGLQILHNHFTTTLSTSTPSNWLTGWTYRKSHTFTSATGAGTNYQMKLTLHYGAGTDSGSDVYLNGKSRADFGDIRFTTVNGTTTVDYWVASSTNSASETVWLKVPDDLSTTNQTVYVYYGNGTATYPYLASTRAQGDATFLFFDNFSVDLSRWKRETVTGVYPQISTTTTPTYERNGGGVTSGNYGFTSLGSAPTFSGFNNNAIGFMARNAANGIGSVAFRGSATTTNTGYMARFDQRTGQGQAFLKPPYNGWNFLSGCTSDANPPTANMWYTYDVTAAGSNFSIYRNGTLMKTCTDSSYASPGQISLQNHYGSYTDYAWVFVRKYQATEPGNGAWGTEEVVPLSSATNVTEVGTPTSYWRYKYHTGALAGEAYDNDPGGDPGYIRWDDSNLTISVSGKVYADEGTTPLGAPTCDNTTPNVKIVVAGGASYTGSCNSTTGAYSIPGVVVPGDPTLTVYLNTAGGAQAATITGTPSGNITNLDLYKNHVIVSEQDHTQPMTISRMSTFDHSKDSDVPFIAATGTVSSLVVQPNFGLYVSASTTFAPGGTVTLNSSGTSSPYDGTLHLADHATFTGSGTSTYSIGGSLIQDSGATFIPASSTVVMTATTTGKGITSVGGETINLNKLTFTGAGGGWNLNGNLDVRDSISLAAGTLTGTGNVTVENGSFSGNGLLSLGTGTTTIDRTNTLGGTQGWTFANLVLGNGTVVGTTTFASRATTTVLGTLTVANAHFLKAGGSVLDLAGVGTDFKLNGTFLYGTSTILYGGVQNANIVSTDYYNLSVSAPAGSPTFTAIGPGIMVHHDLTIGSSGITTVNFNTNDPALDVQGTVTIDSNGTLVGSNTGMFTVEGSWVNAGSYVHSNGSVVFDSSALGNLVQPGGSSFYNVSFNNASGGWKVGPSMRADGDLSLLSASSFVVATSTGGGANWYNTSWSYRKQITIDHTKVSHTGTTTLANFPVLIDTTNSNLKYRANGGNVGKSNGGDILFTSSDGTTKLAHDLEKYGSTTGEVVAWVQVPVLSTSTDTVLYMYYGNAGATNQWNTTGTWNDGGSNYFKGVYHMKEATGVNPADASPAGNNATQVGSPVQTVGQIDGSLSLNGTSQEVDTTYTQSAVTNYTVGAWLKTTDAGTERAIVQDRGTGTGQSLTLGIGTTGGGHGGPGKVGFELDSNTIDIGVSSVPTVNDGNWHYVVGTWSAPSGVPVNPSQFKIYIDGSLVATTSGIAGSANSPLTGSGGAKIGRHDAWGTRLAGTVDEVHIATVVRSADWIKTEYTNQSAPSSFYAFGGETSPGSIIEVRGTFTNAVGGANTTWTGSTLYINSGTTETINTKTAGADAYATLQVGSNTHVRMWNSSAATSSATTTSSIYSQNQAGVSGNLSIYGNYVKTSGSDYWSYATDFDGTALGAGARPVHVTVSSGGAVHYLGSASLLVQGTGAATTTIDHQSTGTYTFNIGGTASTTMNYYDIQHTDSAGLTFSGTPHVGSLSFGNYTVSATGASGMTVGGTAINANPALTFTNNSFATSSGVTSAYNVTATGTSVSSWRFTNHRGNLAGEAHDNDPGGDPGYIVWDDSSANITIAGHVYSDEGTTVSAACNGTTADVHIVVAGVTTYTGACNATTGAYSIGGISYSPGDSVVVYLAGVAQKAATVTNSPVTSISNMDLYEHRVIVRNESTAPLTIANMATWDSTHDSAVPYTATLGTPNTLTLPADTKLIVWTGKTFAPGGNVTVSGGGAGSSYDGTVELFSGASWTGGAGAQYLIGGSFLVDSGATFSASTASTTFTSSVTGRTIHTNGSALYNVSFTGSGSWLVTDSAWSAHTIVLTSGTLTLPTGTTTVSGSFNNAGGSFIDNGSPFVFTATGSGNVVHGGGSRFGALHFTGTGSWSMTDTNATSTGSVSVTGGTLTLPSGTLAVDGSFRNLGGTLVHNNGTVALDATSSAILYAHGSDLGSVTQVGAGPYTMQDGSLTLAGNLSINAGSMTLATNTLSIGGSFTAVGGTFNNATGTVLFNAVTTGHTINPGSSSFYNVVFGSAAGGWTISGNATTTHNLTLTAANAFTLQSGKTLTVGNVFTNNVGGNATTWTGSTLRLMGGVADTINTKTAGGDNYDTLAIGPNTDVAMWNSHATTTSVSTSGSLYSMNNGNVAGNLAIYGDYHIGTTTQYWSYATDFDGTALGAGARTVTVTLAQHATTTVDGGSLIITGAAGHETTVTNQGTGTYDFAVTGGAFDATYYKFRNLDSKGLQLSGTPTISSLSYGDFVLAVNGGNLISLSSTTLNANASKVIVGDSFATTTAITGYNVYLTGSTSNAWTFAGESGNLAGEAYDHDGGSACGSIRWSDSSCLVTEETEYRWRHDDGGLGVPNTEWFNTSWSKRMPVRIDNADATSYTNVSVKLHVPYDAAMRSDFGDLRFTDQSGTSTIPYFIASSTSATAAEVWVKVPSLPAKGTATVYMYYGNTTATTVSSSTQTFIAADDFESGSLSAYSGDTSLFSVNGTHAYGGSYGLDNSGHQSAKATNGIARFDQTTSQGNTIEYKEYISTGTGDEVCTLFGVQSPVTLSHNYAACIEQYGTDHISIVKNAQNTENSGTILASSSATLSNGWYTVSIKWATNNTITITLYNSGGVSVATAMATDSMYTLGGMGFTYWYNYGGWDNYLVRKLTTTDPTVRFGLPASNGGASWSGAQNTPLSILPLNSVRLRTTVENSGLNISGQQFQLEYAGKSTAPSCEAVPSVNFTPVPSQTSCGSSPICMMTSANYTNGDQTSDLLTGAAGQAVYGQAIQDPNNKTSSSSLAQNTFTELEYALEATSNATDSAYCFRVSNNGASLDTYLKLPELQLEFDPTFGPVTFNGGSNISLLPGTTTRVYATATVTDLNGYTDLVAATSTMYTSSSTAACSPNNNDCYISNTAGKCSFTSCSGNSCVLSCYADIYYYADPTDTSGGNFWYAFLEAHDHAGGVGFNTSPGIDINTLRALNVTNAINYGALAPSSNTGSYNASTTVENTGNNPIDINISGTDLSSGYGSSIPVSAQKFATSTFSYSSCTNCTTLSTTSITYHVNLAKPVTATPPVAQPIYWGIAVPFGVNSNAHTGFNTFYAVGVP